MSDRIVVMGLGVTGRSVVEALLQRDHDVIALDDHITDEMLEWGQSFDVAVSAPVEADLVELMRGADGLLPAPGLPDRHPIFTAAGAAGVDVMSEFDLAAGWDDRPVIAVTGTDGKTTVVTLVQRMLERSGRAAAAVGNTDVPYVRAIDDPVTEVFVVEASSFRLGHSRRFSPQVATWLNFGPDHLDAHADLNAYETAKASIWAHLDPGALAVANRQDSVVMRHARAIDGAEVETFGADLPPTERDHGVDGDTMIVAGQELLAIDTLRRALPHDVQNGLAAAASSLRMGASRTAVTQVLQEFGGLEHRVELIAEIDGVRYVNDSKATTPHAAAAAIGGFESVVLLAGGKNKGLNFDAMTAHRDRLVHVVALGHAAPEIEAVFEGKVATTAVSSMEEAVATAAALAGAGDVVLLSPACASYDWYGSYRERGDHFAQIVRARIGSKEIA